MRASIVGLSTVLAQEASPVTSTRQWSYFGLGMVTGGSIQAASHYEDNSCLSDISSVSSDLYMVLYLNDGADLASGKFLTSETAPYLVSIIDKMLEWECWILLSDLG